LIVKWIVTLKNGSTIESRSEPGRVMLARESKTLKVFLTSEDLDENCPPLELIEMLADFCGIVDPDHVVILTHILMQKNFKRIEDDLQRRGLSDSSGSRFPEIEECKFSIESCPGP
jgi:hypothetical protein